MEKVIVFTCYHGFKRTRYKSFTGKCFCVQIVQDLVKFNKYQTTIGVNVGNHIILFICAMVILNRIALSSNESFFAIYDVLFKTYNGRCFSVPLLSQSKYPPFFWTQSLLSGVYILTEFSRYWFLTRIIFEKESKIIH